ncbi:hypothetical protein MIMGU_mgv11b015827mg [Erythranthe guttata]|uniref:TF-B3 domain-containing protein n=1 Tax=Erythranthe guttata TaxID=4155 RepID=A0A022Q6M2_ERYGU|nr:hypothetical protein MIMGU_mgv11b015827mg [Erythranthe guttata]
MVPGFQTHLNLPSAVCKKLKEKKSKRAILKSSIGKWKIDVCRNNEGLICFENGWPQFVNDHCLSIGDFVVFEHTGDFNFNVSVFDHTACEKELSIESKKERRENNKGELDHNSQTPHFVLTMKPSFARRQPRVNIPRVFVRSNSLGDKSSATLRDPHKRAWPVKLVLEANGRSRVLMCRGWHDFYVSNELKDGDICRFELNLGSLQTKNAVMDVQISRALV